MPMGFDSAMKHDSTMWGSESQIFSGFTRYGCHLTPLPASVRICTARGKTNDRTSYGLRNAGHICRRA